MRGALWFWIVTVVAVGACGRGEAPRPTGRETPEQLQALFERRLPGSRIMVDAGSRYARSIELAKPMAVPGAATAMETARQFLDMNKEMLLPPTTQLVPEASYADPRRADRSVITFKQLAGTIPVFGAEVRVWVSENGARAVADVDSAIAETLPEDLQADISQERARDVAAAEYRRTEDAALPSIADPQLVIYSPARLGLPGQPVLAWLVDVGSLRVFVDANSGAIAHQYWNAPSIAREVFDCVTKSNCPLAFADETQKLKTASPESRRLKDLMRDTVSYFATTYQHDGYDGRPIAQPPVRARARVWRREAYYDDQARRLEFPQGWVTRDVVAHEFTHAILFVRKGMIYSGQPGNVQEFFADVFAMLVDSGNAWEIGEQVISNIYPAPLRDLRTPKKYGFDRSTAADAKQNGGQPEHLTELVLPTHRICASLPRADGGCVHFNGSILSLAAYRAVEGLGSSPGFGKTKFGHIAYAAMIDLTVSPWLREAAAKLAKVCAEFAQTGAHGVQRADCNHLDTALRSVGFP